MVLLDDPTRTPVGWVRVAKIVLVAQMVLLVAVDFSGANARSYFKDDVPYPRWTALVEAAWDRCDRQPSAREEKIDASFFFPVTAPARRSVPRAPSAARAVELTARRPGPRGELLVEQALRSGRGRRPTKARHSGRPSR